MIGKPEWFTYRKFGWGVSPKTWQGWVYVGVIAVLAGAIISSSAVAKISMWLFFALMAIIILDILHIMTKLPQHHDERENLQQLIIERNCSFAAIAALVMMAFYEWYQNKDLLAAGMMPFDISIIVVLGAMVVTKVISALYLKARM